MLKEKAGVIAGQIWEALNGKEKGMTQKELKKAAKLKADGMTQKELKKAAKLKADKDLFLGLGWLLREDKIETKEEEGELSVKLK